MKRRDFIKVIGGVAATCPLVTWAQQATSPVIGFLHSASPGPYARSVAAFLQRLSELG